MKTYEVKCGDHVHRIGMEIKDLSLYALDHDLEAERVAAQLGAGMPACLEIVGELKRSPNQAMIWAIKLGQTALLPIALDMGADASYHWNRPLKFAALKGYANAVELLLKHGADANATGGRALRWSAQNGHLDVVKVLLGHNPERLFVQEALNEAHRQGMGNVSYYLYTWLERHPE